MKKFIFVLAIAATLLTSCYEYPDSDGLNYAQDQLITVTHIDQYYDFKECRFFYLQDSITDISIDANGDEVVEKKSGGKFYENVVKNMEAYGYIQIDTIPTTLEDHVLYFDLAYVESENVEVTSFGYGWWYDYYYPYYWGGYYPVYYPSYTYCSSYESKMLVVNCNTLDKREQKETMKNRWLGMVRGVDDFSANDVLKNLDQAFEQSPELNRN